MASTHHGVVYTKKWVVDLILDVAGYVPGTGISDKVIIEPSCGCGAFLTVIAGRLADDAIAVGKGWTSLGERDPRLRHRLRVDRDSKEGRRRGIDDKRMPRDPGSGALRAVDRTRRFHS